eukprot:gb/GFBE01037289.1/.p1 GENE.gb/GFBE01037289.1/~~gb/GFBE01037289.1/.p1  ORF type:complete len:956 (+),score=124.88 gb/GFBE01037289.1/:1-2868(+)
MGSYRQEPGMPLGAPGADRRGYGGGESSRLATSRTAQRNRKGLLGLSNLGNTCFMNAALQCLTHTHGLQKYFRFCSHAYTSRGQSSRQRLLMAFAHWFERDWGKNVSAHYHSPEDIFRSVQQLNPIFQGYSQQDSQEFLRCVLDNIHEELRREVPDDLDGHLGQLVAPEDGGTSASDSGRNARPAAPQRSAGSSSTSAASHSYVGSGGSAEAPHRGSSTTHNLMQFCQSPEHATDAGEIRLPARSSSAPWPPSESGDSTVASSSSTSCPNFAATGESSEGGEESSSEKTQRKTHFESIVSELFQGKVVSCVRCLECKKTSRTPEAVYDVSVSIPNANEPSPAGADGSPLSSLSSGLSPSAGGLQRQASGGLRSTSSWSGVLGGLGGKVKSWFYDKGVDVSDCLRRHCAPEYLTGKDQYECERCKRKNDCEKRIAFKDLPEVLCIHIKRFRYDTGWFNGTKNSRVVTFPVNTPLDMAPFLDEPPGQPVEYRLIGLIQHIGSMGGGHYIAYCQHKRKPQDWYEFDDTQVNLVSAEQVERAEPYVLFYQRVPSKGARLDRQTFKHDMRRTQEQIRNYLMSSGMPSAPSSSSTSRPRSTSQDGHSDGRDFLVSPQQAVAEEMRHHGPALRGVYRSPPSELDVVFVSKHWYVRLTTMSHPGPIDNHEYLCPHKLLGCCSAEMAAEPFIPISRSLFQSLIGKYGGGPEISALEICPKCQAYLSAYNVRKQAEFELVSKYDTKTTGDGEGWYLVDALWVNNWKCYVKGEPVTDVRDLCAPGPITNERLFDKDDPSKLRKNLRLKLDYIGVNARVWWLFMHIHGGGPAIVRDQLEKYSDENDRWWQELPAETELIPEELRSPAEGSDFAMTISRQFVDECRGDLALYRQLYPGGCFGGVEASRSGAAADGTAESIDQLEAPAEEAARPPLPGSEAPVMAPSAGVAGDTQQSQDVDSLPAAATT